MKFTAVLFAILALVVSINAAALPDISHLFKRKGGGGGGRGGGGGSRSSSSSSSSSSSNSGSSSGRTSGSTGSSGSRGVVSGPSPRSYGGGRYYGGGATSAFSAGPGRRSPSGILPFLFVTPALFLGGLWLGSVYAYPYTNPYSFRNTSADANSTTNTTLPVNCLCDESKSCGCDEPDDDRFLDQIVGNGTITNSSLAQVANINGTDTLLLNGTISNGTQAAAASAGATSAASPSMRLVGMQWGGWAILSAGVAYTVWFA